MNNTKLLVDKLIVLNKTISTMESCTGGYIVNAITNIEGASTILQYSAVTYSNSFKIKMGVSEKIIDKYSVYSIETAKEMSKTISLFTDSNYGIGVTGKLNCEDKNNLTSPDNFVYISIYNNDKDSYITDIIQVSKNNREDNKKEILDKIILMLLKELNS